MVDPLSRTPSELVPGGIRAVNLGVAELAEAPSHCGADVVHADWRPPANGDRELGILLARLEDDPDDAVGAQVQQANATAVERILRARPMLVDVRPAEDVIPGLGRRTLLHAGPPIVWAKMCGPMRGAVIGAVLFERWAATAEQAAEMVARGVVSLAPCHHHRAVGPMAGVVSPSMSVLVVENAAHGNRSYATLNEGLGKVLRFGVFAPAAIDEIRHLAGTIGPALGQALRAGGPIDLKAIISQALQMGDDCHNRNVASTSLFTRAIAPALVHATDVVTAAATLEFLRRNDQFHLNVSMAACKAILDAASGISGSTVVTAMARNGVDFGIRLSGTGEEWFTAPAPAPVGLYFPEHGPADANPDLGDSAITETCGLGGFAMAAAPAIVRLVGGSVADAQEYTRQMYAITLARNGDFALPYLEFAGAPTAIDARRVVESGLAPVVNTGIAHREAGGGQIGAGIVRAPLECFSKALRALGRQLGLGGQEHGT